MAATNRRDRKDTSEKANTQSRFFWGGVSGDRG
jgi:hypothetical protein